MGRWPLLLVLAVLTVLPPGAHAQDALDYGSIDAYYVPQADGHWPPSLPLDDSGDGFGLRVLSRATDRLMVLGEAQRLSYGGDATQQLRVGAGLAQPSTTGLFLTLDWLDLDRDEAIALGLHGRVAGTVAGPLSLYGQLGYLGMDTGSLFYDGFEMTLGLTWDLPGPWGVFADYRATLLDDRDGVERLHHDELRLGLRFRFDC